MTPVLGTAVRIKIENGVIHMRRIPWVLLFLLLLLLVSCKAAEEPVDAPEAEIVYQSEFVNLALGSENVIGVCRSGDFLYVFR